MIAGRIARRYDPNGQGTTAAVKSMTEFVLGRYDRLFLLLLVAVALVLLIASVNVANLLLVRSAERSREIAIRSALGANRSRLFRQLLTESMLLAAGGGAIGVGLAWAGINPIRAMLPASSRIPRVESIHLDLRVCLFAVLISVLTGLFFGIVPALRCARADVNGILKESGRGSTMGSGKRLANALIVTEVAFSLTLLVGAGLVLRSFMLLQNVDPGFDTNRLLTLQLRLPAAKYSSDASVAAVLKNIEERARSLPGVRNAALTAQLPFEQFYNPWSFIQPGQQFSERHTDQMAHIQRVSWEYFQTLGVPLRSGRSLQASDVAGKPNAVVISQTMAAHFWPNQNPVGTMITVDLTKSKYEATIVGVAGDGKLKGLGVAPYPEMFWSLAQFGN